MHFLLSLNLKHKGGYFDISAYNHQGNVLDVNKKDPETIEISVSMPNQIYLTLSGKDYSTEFDKSLELVSMSLAGIRFNGQDLHKLAVYSPDWSDAVTRTFDEYKKLSPSSLTVWDRNGCVIVNLFDNDPFLYHMNVGTKIKY